jgi:hypothetical protein
VPDAPYRAPLKPPPDPYAVAWADLRKRRVWSGVFLIAYVCMLALILGLHILGLHVPRPVLLFFPLLIALMLAYPHHRFRCPHCGKKGAIWKQCKACGIRIGTPKSAVDEAARQRAAGRSSEQAAAAGTYRVAEAEVAEAVAVDDEPAPEDGVSHSRRRG